MAKFEVEVEITTVERKKIIVHADSAETVKVEEYHLGCYWQGGKRTYQAIGEPVELTDELKFERCIPKPEAWELYSVRSGWKAAALQLNSRLRSAFRRIRKAPASKVREALKEERQRLYEVMGKKPYVSFGATDSEPRNCADDAFTKFARTVLGLDVRFSYGGMTEE